MREFLLMTIRAVLKRSTDSGDPDIALDPRALAAAAELLEATADPGDDLEVAYLVGFLHWYRFLTLFPNGGEHDHDLAMRLFYPVYRDSPENVPAMVREYFQGGGKFPADDPSDQGSDAYALSEQGLNLLEIAQRTGGSAELDGAIQSLRGALNAAPDNHPGRARWRSNLGVALRARFERNGSSTDLEDAVAASRAAVAETPTGDPVRAAMLSNLGAALATRFRYRADLTDLDEAIGASREALAVVARDDADRTVVLAILSAALLTRFRHVGAHDDLVEAITVARQAIRETPPGDPPRAGDLAALSNALLTQFEDTGDPADLDEAIEAARAAAEALPAGHPNLTRMLSNLGAALTSRFELAGDLGDLNEAIAVGQRAVEAVPERDPVRPEMLFTLGIALAKLYEHTGELTNLDKALAAMRDGIEAAPTDHVNLPTMRINFSVALHMRYERTRAEADLDASIDAARLALKATEPGHPHRPAILSSLSSSLRTRFQLSGDSAELDEAVATARQAVDVLPIGHPDRGPTSSNYGAALAVRHRQTGDSDDLTAAIAAFQEAVDATPQDQPNRALMLGNLGESLIERFEKNGDRADLTEAIAVERQAVASTNAQPWVRAGAARGWGWAAGVLEDWPEAVLGFEKAAELLGLVAPRSLHRSDQEHLLEGLDGGAAQAAACCIRAGRADRAIELLEQTRGILLSQALDTRTDLAELAGHHPDLAGRFVKFRDALDQPDSLGAYLAAGPSGQAAIRASAEAERRRSLAQDFDQLLAEIRAAPDFEDFLRPLPISKLTSAAAEGPVVIVNASRFGSHALILTSTGLLEPLPLPELTLDRVLDQVIQFVTVVSGGATSFARQRQLTGVLGWLWDAIAGPVLEHLGFHGRPDSSDAWPRIWWCAPGLLSFLPLHAAGHHHTRSDSSPRTVADRVVSSYTPTIRALMHARRQPVTPPVTATADAPDIAVIAMPHTPGASDLPSAIEEAQLLDGRFASRTDTYVGAEAVYDKVTRAMSATRWAHFACHGAVDPASPSVGRLLLHDHQLRPLTVADVARLHLDKAEFAFLSACTTAHPGDRLTDEAIHLTSAFQLAGYRHVIGTLWPINDAFAVKIADAVYQSLADTGASGTAVALHAAIRRVRDERPNFPFLWAAHIHVGP